MTMQQQHNIQIDMDKIRATTKLFVATPMYGGHSHGMYQKSNLDLQTLCLKNGVDIRFSMIFNESLITRARNYCVDEFLRSDATHLLFIDGDIHYNPIDIFVLLHLDKDVIGGPYPKKSIKWNNIIAAVERNYEARMKDPKIEKISGAELEKCGGDYVFNAVAGTGQFNVLEPLQVLEIGTGFMLIKRQVFEKFAEQYPQQRYKPDHVGQANFDGSRYIHAYLDTVIDSKQHNLRIEVLDFLGKNPDATLDQVREFVTNDVSSINKVYSDRYLSEDYMFCQWWRNMGGEIWLCPWMRTHHIGTYPFHGDMPAVANYVGTL
jgi:hypothetical protein